MGAKRPPTNSELWLAQLARDEELRVKELGILELFPRPEPVRDEDRAVERDPED